MHAKNYLLIFNLQKENEDLGIALMRQHNLASKENTNIPLLMEILRFG